MKSRPAKQTQVRSKLLKVTDELHQIQEELLNSEDLDPSILAAFRQAVNRVRTTAWAMQQYTESQAQEGDPKKVLSLMAGERVRVVFQLCKLIQADLADEDIHVPIGPLMQLHAATKELTEQLRKLVGD